jgi:hypothetical protein
MGDRFRRLNPKHRDLSRPRLQLTKRARNGFVTGDDVSGARVQLSRLRRSVKGKIARPIVPRGGREMYYEHAQNQGGLIGEPQSGASASPPPGWYPDPANGAPRWWDGAQWGPQAPPVPLTPVVPAAIQLRRPWPWAVAGAPLVQLGVAIMAAFLGGPSGTAGEYLLIGALVAALFAIIAARRDVKALRAAGETVSPAMASWCLLSPWAYLIARAVRRSSRTGADWGLLAGTAAIWLIALVISVPIINSVITDASTINQAQLQSQIASSIKAKSGVAVTVNCPKDPPVNPGSQFQCIATAADGSTVGVTVTVQDRSGDVIWQVTG